LPSLILSSEDYFVLALYFVLILFIGFRAGRKQGKADFLLAGRTLTLPLFVMTLVSSWYGGILGVGEFSYRYGISNWVVQGLPYYLFALIFAWLLAQRIRATNLVTIPDRLHGVYDRKTAILGAILTFLLTTPAPYILMVGILLQVSTGWSLLWCILLGTAATTAYLFTGGFRADVYTDVAEFVVMFIGFGVALAVAASTLGGMDYLTASLPSLHLTWHGGNSWQFIIVWFLIALWTLVDPSFHQRCYAAKDGKTARRGILLSIPIWFIFDALTATTGLYARAVLPDLENPVMAYPMFAETVLPPVAKGLFVAGMLATVMSTLNTMTFISATTLGKDIFCRILPAVGEESMLRATRYGLLFTGLLSIGLCFVFPSVIVLWYVVGTSIIPGLLVPVVTSYFAPLKADARTAFISMIAGWLTATIWLVTGWSGGGPGSGTYPFGIEPMFPGLIASIAVWATGILAGNSKSEQSKS
jgi:SSS family solute:Na+ symporter